MGTLNGPLCQFLLFLKIGQSVNIISKNEI
jgi:hypothetical protein